MRKILLVIVSILLISTAVLCSCGEPEHTPTTTAPAYAQPIAEAMLKALSDGDFQGYCFYISPAMAARTTEDIFKYFKDFYKARIGDYISLKFYDVQVGDNITTVIFTAKYSKSDKVTVTLYFIPYADAVVVDNLVLDSPELRVGGSA